MFVTLRVFIESDQIVAISNDPYGADGIILEVTELDGKTNSPHLRLSPSEINQLACAMKSVDDLRRVK